MPIDASKPPERVFSSAEEEIRALEQKLEEKKRELTAQQGGEAMPHEKEMFREVLREQMDRVTSATPSETPMSSLPPLPPLPPPNVQPPLDDAVVAAEREQAVAKLIELALTQGIDEAVKSAQADPYMLDALHDRLVDEYYDRLLQLRKVTPM